jgi:hypothetical protein
MAGSQTWRVYVDDLGNRYSVPVSKHVGDGFGQALELGTNSYLRGALFDKRTQNYPLLPRGVVMRYAVCHRFVVGQKKAGKSRIIHFGSTDLIRILRQYIPSIRIVDPRNGETVDWVPTSVCGEKFPCVPRPDDYT